MAETSAVSHRSTEAIEKQWPIFTEAVAARLIQGAEDYGDRSLDAPPDQLIGEIEQELLDVVGWGFILWLRLQRMSDRIRAHQSKQKIADP